MPTYIFKDKDTNQQWSEMMTIAEMEKILNDNKNIELLPSSPMVVSGVSFKPDGEFRDRLKEIKKKHPLGDFNTF